MLKDLPRSAVASHDETLYFIESHRRMGRGIGYIDAQLLAATSLEGTSIPTVWANSLVSAEVVSEARKRQIVYGNAAPLCGFSV